MLVTLLRQKRLQVLFLRFGFQFRFRIPAFPYALPRFFEMLIILLVDTISLRRNTYLLNEGEKTPLRKIVILVKLLLRGKNPSFFVNYYFQTHFKCCPSTVFRISISFSPLYISFRFVSQNRISRFFLS